MQDTIQILKNVQSLYENKGQLKILTDFERVFDRLDLYLYENWKNGELINGPIVERHRVSCSFMWKTDEMPNPQGGTRLIENGCKVTFKKDELLKPRQIKSPGDYRPGTTKGKIDAHPIWIVEIRMPKELIGNFKYGKDKIDSQDETDTSTQEAGLDAI